MRRKVLVAEAVDTMRSVAETVLRQNGFEVIAVADANKVKEVLKFSRPDLVVVGADLLTSDETPCYERIRQDPKSAEIPMLLFAPSDNAFLDFPEEVIISRPFDPKDFLAKVNHSVGQVQAGKGTGATVPDTSPVDDDFLDAALGLDNIDVTDSEDMDKTFVRGRDQSADPKKDLMVGLDATTDSDKLFRDSSKIESLVINENESHVQKNPRPSPPPLAGTGKLEILNDQYGLNDPSQLDNEVSGDKAHDYDWFINAVREDNNPEKPVAGAKDSSKISIDHLSGVVDPLTPVKGAKISQPGTAKPKAAAGVEQFIDEFKKEIEQLRSDEPDELSIPLPNVAEAVADKMTWDESVEDITPEHARLFAREIAREVGRTVAEIIVSKIDSDKLLRLIKDEVVRRHSGESPNSK